MGQMELVHLETLTMACSLHSRNWCCYCFLYHRLGVEELNGQIEVDQIDHSAQKKKKTRTQMEQRKKGKKKRKNQEEAKKERIFSIF